MALLITRFGQRCVYGAYYLLLMTKPLLCPTPAIAVTVGYAFGAASTLAKDDNLFRRYDIPPGEAAHTLKLFAEVSGEQVVYLVEAVRNVRTNAVAGEYTARDALNRLVEHTNLRVIEDTKSGALMVARVPGEEARTPGTQTEGSGKKKSFGRWHAFIAVLTAPLLSGQVAPSGSEAPPENEVTVTLSPFEVTADKDRGYTAASTLAGARVPTLLRETPAVIGVLDRQFLDDVMAQNITDFGNWAPNVVIEDDSNSNSRTRDLPIVNARGLSNNFAEARNYFSSTVAIDSYNIERLEIPRGPNALLYGDGPLGGIATSNTKRAVFGRNFAATQLLVDSYGSKRGTLDLNRELWHRKISARLNAVVQRNRGWRPTTVADRTSVDGTISIRPWKGALFRGEIEWGQTKKDGEDSNYFENISSWNGTTIFTSPNAAVSGTGTTRVNSGGSYLVWNQSAPQDGLVDRQGNLTTIGSGRTILPAEYASQNLRPGTAFPTPYLRSRDQTIGPRNARNWMNFSIWTASFEQVFFEKLAVEIAANFERPKRFWYRDRPNQYFLDLNPTLPDGRVNPGFMKAYDDSNMIRQYTIDQNTSYRATIAYPFDFGFTAQKVVLMGGRNETYGRDHMFRPMRLNNPTVRNLQQATNQISVRRYWDDASAPWTDPKSSNGYEVGEVDNLLQGSKSTLDYAQLAATGTYFKRQISSIFGYRIDRYIKDSSTNFATSNDWERGVITANDYLPPLKSDPKDANGNPIPGLKNPLGLPSEIWSSQRLDVVNPGLPYDPIKNPRYADVFPLKGTLHSFSAGTTWFPVKALGVFVNASSGFQTQGFASRLNFAPAGALENNGLDVGLKLELFGGKISGTISTYRNNQKGYSVSNGSPFYNTWNSAFQGYSNIATVTTDPVLAKQYQAKADEAFAKRESVRYGFNDYQELRAKGYEVDLTANLTRNWRSMFNLGLPEAHTYNRLVDTKAYYAVNKAAFQAYLDDTVGLSPDTRTTIANNISTTENNIHAAVDGYTAPGTPKYNANFFTTYSFSEGRLKNWRTGGGLQFKGQAAITTTRQIYGVNPANGQTQFYGPNPLDNLFVPSYKLMTLMVGYEMKLWKLKWNFQINVSNVLNEDQILFTNYTTYTYTSGGTTKGVQVPNAFRYIEPRKAVFSANARF